MKRVLAFVGIAAILAATLQTATARVEEGPVHGYLPHQGVFYTRYPTYKSHPLGYSESHGINPRYLTTPQRNDRYGQPRHYATTRPFLGSPRLTSRNGFVAQRHNAIVHNWVRPTLYPGLYRTEVIK